MLQSYHPHIHSVLSFVSIMIPDELQRKRQTLHSLVKEYTHDFPPIYFGPPSKRSAKRKGAVVLVSGTTGAFGSNILAILAQAPQVETVYAISRPTKLGPNVFERHVQAVLREGFSANLLAGGKVQMIEGELHLDEFGLEHELYEKVRTSLVRLPGDPDKSHGSD